MQETNATQAAELPVPDETPDPSPDAADTSEKSEPKKETRDDEPSEKVQKRISKLTGKWRQAQSEAEYWRERALAQKESPPPPTPAPQAKKLADFNYDEEAYERYVEQRQAEREQQGRQRSEKERAETSRKQLLQKFWERAEEVRGDVEDFDDLVSSAPISDAVSDMVMHMEDGPHIALHLARNPSVAKSISNLPEHLAAARLIALSDRLATEREQAKAKPVSKAPPPPPRLDTSETGVEDDPDKMSTKAWLKWRNKQLAKK